MTNELIDAAQPQEGPPPGQIPEVPATQLKKSRTKIWLIIGIIIAVLCLCSVVCVAIFGINMYKVYTQKAPVLSVLDTYMQHMENKDAEEAYALLSPRAQRQIQISEIEELFEGNNYYLFEGYQSLSVTNINMMASANTNPDLPQGTVANVRGTITYNDDVLGWFEGTLEDVDGTWMIHRMFVSIPPDKIK